MGFSKDEANRIAVDEGWFNSIPTLQDKFVGSDQQWAAVKAAFFRLILTKIIEAKKEVAHLEGSVRRLEAAARAGAIPKPSQANNPNSPDVMLLRNEMKTFHGWTVSLLESDISILAAIDDPKIAGNSVKGLQRSFAELWALRVEEGFKMMRSHPEVFERVLGR